MRFGIAIPIKEIGPQKAVIIPVNKAVIEIRIYFSFLTCIPKYEACVPPNTYAFNGLIQTTVKRSETKNKIVNNGISSRFTCCTEPKPQIVNAFKAIGSE